jgi:tetratricopeptide (TPR) repeat protein
MIYPTLMIYDHGSQTSTQISALLPLESEYPVTTSLVDWTAAEFDFPQGLQTTDSTTPVPPSSAPSTDNGQQNPINTNPLGGFSNLLYCLLCLPLLIILAALAVFLFSRRRKSKDAREEKQEHTEHLPPPATSADQIKKAIELSKSKQHKEAFEILRGIIQAEPNNMSAWFNLGGVLASMGNYKDAERCYSRAKELGHPRGEDALRWLRQNRR